MGMEEIFLLVQMVYQLQLSTMISGRTPPTTRLMIPVTLVILMQMAELMFLMLLVPSISF